MSLWVGYPCSRTYTSLLDDGTAMNGDSSKDSGDTQKRYAIQLDIQEGMHVA